jgi:hypothetical protein
MRRFVFVVAAVLVAGVGYAKPTFVTGASCKSCHETMPPKKDNLNKTAAEMVKKYKVDECKNCHAWTGGKFTSKKA